MKILVLSDLHADNEPYEVPEGLDYDVAVVAGDILEPGRDVARWLRAPGHFGKKPVVQIAGNHEFYGSVVERELEEMRSQAAEHGIHFLDCDEVRIGGVRFLGCTLFTDFGLRIRDPGFGGQVRMLSDRFRAMGEAQRHIPDYRGEIKMAAPRAESLLGTRLLAPMDTLLIHRRHRGWLRSKLAEPFEGKTVVVTHHAPHRGSLADYRAEEWTSAAYVSELAADFFQHDAVTFVHGHTHASFDYRVGSCRIVCNARGYLDWHGVFENMSFDPGFIVEV